MNNSNFLVKCIIYKSDDINSKSHILRQEVVDKMAAVATDYNEEMGWENVPIEPVMLIKATLLPAQ